MENEYFNLLHPHLISKIAVKVQLPGKGYVQGCCALPNGKFYVARWSCLIEVDEEYNAQIYAGDMNIQQSIMGHRLKMARFQNIHAVAGVHDVILAYDHGACILAQIENDEVSKLAGSGTRGTEDGPKDKATFDYVWGMTVTASGHLLMTERDHHRVRILSPDGMVTSIGSGQKANLDGNLFENAAFSSPFGLCSAPDGSVYVSCNESHNLRKIDAKLRWIETVEGPEIDRVEGITVSASGDVFLCGYIANSVSKYSSANKKSPFSIPFHVTDSPRGVCIPKKGVIAVSENTDKLEVSIFKDAGDDIVPFWPYVFNMSLFKGSKFDFVGFEALSIYRPSTHQSEQINSNSPALNFPEQIPDVFAPSDLCILPNGLPALSYHSHMIKLLLQGTEPFSAFEDLTAALNLVTNIHALFLRFLYSCGNTVDLADVPTSQRASVCAIMCHVLSKMGFSSQKLRTELASSLGSVPAEKLLELLVFMSTRKCLEIYAIELICAQIGHGDVTSISENEAFGPLKNNDPYLFGALIGRISGKHKSLFQLLLPREQINDPSVALDMGDSSAAEPPESSAQASSADWFEESGDFSEAIDLASLSVTVIPESSKSDESVSTELSTSPAETMAKQPVKEEHRSQTTPDLFDAIQNVMNDLAYSLEWETLSTEGISSTATELESSHLWLIKIQNYPKVLRVADWVLYSRWSYFRRMIDSGFGETSTRVLEFPSDFPPNALLALIRYLYNSFIEDFSLSASEATYLFENSEEFELVSSDLKPTRGFCRFCCILDNLTKSSEQL